MTEQPAGGHAPAEESATSEAGRTELPPEEEPTTTGTLFVMLLFLMALAGLWVLMYMVLLER